MALVFLETLSYCSIRKVSVSNNFFILFCFDWLKTLLNWFLLDWLCYWFYIWMWTHTWSVMKVGFREQINFMKFIKVCVLALEKQWSIKYDFAIKFIKCQTISYTNIHIKSNEKYSFITVFTCSFYPIIYCTIIICKPVSWFPLQRIDWFLYNDNTNC